MDDIINKIESFQLRQLQRNEDVTTHFSISSNDFNQLCISFNCPIDRIDQATIYTCCALTKIVRKKPYMETPLWITLNGSDFGQEI